MRFTLRNSFTRAAVPVAFTQSSTTPSAHYTRRLPGSVPVVLKTRRTYVKKG